MPTDSSSQASTSSSVSKKQEHLESGRRKLDKFRKKKGKSRENNRPLENLIDGEIIPNNGASPNAADEGIATEEVVSIPSGSRESLNILSSENGFPQNKEHTNLVSQNERPGRAIFEVTAGTYVHGAPNTGDLMDTVVKISDGDSQNTLEFNGNSLMYDGHKENGMKSGFSENLPSFMAHSNNSLSFSRRLPFQPNRLNHQMPMADSREDALSYFPQDLSLSDRKHDRENARNTGKHASTFLENDVHSKKDDFTALEQHIDELTQEKFSLQRALDAARSLTESLSQQNSSLAEDFNSQATVINQLQEELEKKNEELASQSLVLSSLMMERERAQQENNSAVERSQILAGEVIMLEEKVLKLRSSELKLQRELESLNSEKDSYRAQLTTIEKDRQHLQSMLEALQEDKKVLLRRLENVVADGPKPVLNAQIETKDASTSTLDLDAGVSSSNAGSSQSRGDMYHLPSSIVLPMPHESGFSELSSSVALSSDDHRTINSIEMLITDLVEEKSYFLQTIAIESSKVAELQALNKELSKKLEVQTQRLELAIAQTMADGLNSDVTNFVEDRSEIDFVDEGDEVVERVLGWIMKLFPGGSSKRRTSRLL